MAGPCEKLLGLLFHFKTGERSLSDFKNSENRASVGMAGPYEKLLGLLFHFKTVKKPIRFYEIRR